MGIHVALSLERTNGSDTALIPKNLKVSRTLFMQ